MFSNYFDWVFVFVFFHVSVDITWFNGKISKKVFPLNESLQHGEQFLIYYFIACQCVELVWKKKSFFFSGEINTYVKFLKLVMNYNLTFRHYFLGQIHAILLISFYFWFIFIAHCSEHWTLENNSLTTFVHKHS